MSEEAIEQVDQPTEAPLLETPADVAQGGSGNDFLTFPQSKMLKTLLVPM
jgi:hypothetical protein